MELQSFLVFIITALFGKLFKIKMILIKSEIRYFFIKLIDLHKLSSLLFSFVFVT